MDTEKMEQLLTLTDEVELTAWRIAAKSAEIMVKSLEGRAVHPAERAALLDLVGENEENHRRLSAWKQANLGE